MLECFFWYICTSPRARTSDMYYIAYAGCYPTAVDQSPANIIISEFVYTTSKERMVARVIFLLASWWCTHYLVEKVHKPVCFVLSFVGPLMKSFRQRAALKASSQSILSLRNFGRSTCKVLAPNVMCRRQFLFSYVCLSHQLHTTPSKEYMYVSSASAVDNSLTEAMSHLLQIVTYLISEERNRIQR